MPSARRRSTDDQPAAYLTGSAALITGKAISLIATFQIIAVSIERGLGISRRGVGLSFVLLPVHPR